MKKIVIAIIFILLVRCGIGICNDETFLGSITQMYLNNLATTHITEENVLLFIKLYPTFEQKKPPAGSQEIPLVELYPDTEFEIAGSTDNLKVKDFIQIILGIQIGYEEYTRLLNFDVVDDTETFLSEKNRKVLEKYYNDINHMFEKNGSFGLPLEYDLAQAK